MKIAFIAIKGIDRIGGVETYTLELGKRLVDAGHQVIVYTIKTPQYSRPFFHEGMWIIPLPTLKHVYFEKMLLVALASFHQFTIKHLDIVHYQAIGPSLFSFIPRLAGRRTIFQSHGHEWAHAWNGLARIVFLLSEKLSFWFAHDSIAVSRSLRHYYHKKYRRDVTYIPSGITPRQAIPCQTISRYGIKMDGYILFVGRLSKEKRVHDLLLAYKRLESPPLKLVIVGNARAGDAYGDELRALAGNDSRIVFTGAVYGDELIEWYSNAYVYVLPSETEGLPITLLEAMSLGRCCIASNIEANVEALSNKGILFPVGDVNALSTHLQQVMTNPAQVKHIGSILHQHVLSNYTWTLITEQFIRFYQKVMQPVSGQTANLLTMQGKQTMSINYPINRAADVTETTNTASIMLPEESRGYYAPPQQQIPFRQYWGALRHNLGPVLLSAIGGALLLLVLAALTNPTYTAKSSIKVDTRSPMLLNYDVDTARPPSYIDETVFYNTQFKMLRSRDLAKRVIDKLAIRDSLLAERPFKPAMYVLTDPFNDLVKFVRSLLPTDGESSNAAEQVTAEEIFLKNLSIKPVKSSRIIDIQYTGQNAEQARNVVQTLTQTFVEQQYEDRREVAENGKRFLNEQIYSAREKLQTAEAALIRYASAKNIVDTNADEPLIAQKLEALSKAYMAAKENRIRTQSQFNNKGELSGILNAEDDPVVQEHKQELGKLQGSYLSNLELFKPNYPAMLSLQEQIRSRERLIAEATALIRKNTVNNLRASFDAAQDEEQKLAKEIKLLEKELLTFRSDNIGYANLKRDVDSLRSLYEGLLQRLKEVSVVETVQSDNVSVVDTAVAPSRKDGPSFSKYLLLGLLSGFLLSSLLILVREIMQPKVRISADLQEAGGKYQVLHALPYNKAVSEGSTVIFKPKSAAVWLDALRYLRTSLVLANHGKFPQILHITSPLPGEGKSTVAVNLATLLASSGHKVLLIDADLRKPTVHKHLNLDNSSGLTNYLSGNLSQSPLYRIKSTRMLFAICAGPAILDPVEALSSSRMQSLLDKARELFDYVVIDAPPVLGMADSLLLSNRADGTLLIVANNTSTKQEVRTSIECLEKSHGKLLGLVQNMVPLRHISKTSNYSDGRNMLIPA
ncbi:capsular exopolysaccharide family [Thiothrix caldifontis]|uniref:Capsular exopolysaccharide family n=1 Tax=Thiothrix caldifontis TaxID=525918 RepID=A0A1H4B188_9GAMM|nr:polysaccharide biosynthesis tyrosine autokinase [Thiothrix caldifontis]SEA41911.1 capsular exopolysaccharide family [Thiothrix caldifontis]